MKRTSQRSWALPFAAIIGAAGCAHVEAPRGGPPDDDPPGIVVTRPDEGAVVTSYDGPVLFQFDERISERGVEDAVMVSPRTSPVEVRHGRQEIRVSLRRGWEPNTIYHITLRPDISDLFGNRMRETTTLVFSTGPSIPDTRSTGSVIDRITGRPQVGIRVEAIRMTDSLVYAVPTDSAGDFRLERIPEGEYQLRAFEDLNRNRALDLFEPRDSSFVEFREGEAVEVALQLLMPDSTPPEALSGGIRGSRFDIEFDDYLDPEQELDPGQIVISDPDGTTVVVERVGIGTLPPLPAADTAAAPAPVPPRPGAPASTPSQPRPSRTLIGEIADPDALDPDTEYTIEVRGIRNVNGLVGDSSVEVATPPAPPTATPPDPPSAAAFPRSGGDATLTRLYN